MRAWNLVPNILSRSVYLEPRLSETPNANPRFGGRRRLLAKRVVRKRRMSTPQFSSALPRARRARPVRGRARGGSHEAGARGKGAWKIRRRSSAPDARRSARASIPTSTGNHAITRARQAIGQSRRSWNAERMQHRWNSDDDAAKNAATTRAAPRNNATTQETNMHHAGVGTPNAHSASGALMTTPQRTRLRR